MQPTIGFDDFLKVDVRIGEILAVSDFPAAKNPAYILKIDFGATIGIKKSSAQITHLYSKESLVGQQILAVVNFEPKQIGPIMSEVLVLGVNNGINEIILIHPERQAPNGTRLH